MQIEQHIRGTGTTSQQSFERAPDDRLTLREFFSMWRTLLRSAAIGTGIGALPGLGATIAGFLGYGAARRASKNPEKFGKGAVEGVAGAEAAKQRCGGC